MLHSKPTTTIYLDTRRQKKDKTFPIKLRVTHKRKRRYYSLNESLSEKDFLKVMNENPRGSYRKLRELLDDKKHDADEVIKNLYPFSFEQFEAKYFRNNRNTDDSNDVFTHFQDYIDDLLKEDRLSTADSYLYAKKSIEDFCSCKVLSFEKVTKQFLERYEKKMLSNDKSITTVGIYLRCLRAIFNLAIKKEITTNYPFGKGNTTYTIKNPPARKMALTTEKLKQVFNYNSFPTKSMHFYVDLWRFSYLCSGINVKDICSLRYGNIERDNIYYKREKTKRSNIGKEVVIPISDEIKSIINKWGQDKINDKTFVFPFLKHNYNPKQIQDTVKQATKQINKYIKKVKKELEIEVKVTSYSARHSYSTHLMRHGASIEFISKQLGHSNIQTTNAYLENFDQKQIKEWHSRLTDFDT